MACQRDAVELQAIEQLAHPACIILRCLQRLLQRTQSKLIRDIRRVDAHAPAPTRIYSHTIVSTKSHIRESTVVAAHLAGQWRSGASSQSGCSLQEILARQAIRPECARKPIGKLPRQPKCGSERMMRTWVRLLDMSNGTRSAMDCVHHSAKQQKTPPSAGEFRSWSGGQVCLIRKPDSRAH